jgi:hypothetical protein
VVVPDLFVEDPDDGRRGGIAGDVDRHTCQPSWRVMTESRVRLPRAVVPPFTVFLNGVRQQEGADYRVDGDMLVFERELVQEGRLGFWRWFWGAWGIGTYRKDDQVDVAWEVDGQPRVAHALEIQPLERAKPG